jgi:hypothetical protein
LIVATTASALVERVGRRPLFITSNIVMLISEFLGRFTVDEADDPSSFLHVDVDNRSF